MSPTISTIPILAINNALYCSSLLPKQSNLPSIFIELGHIKSRSRRFPYK